MSAVYLVPIWTRIEVDVDNGMSIPTVVSVEAPKKRPKATKIEKKQLFGRDHTILTMI